jgi:hypothetical protein
MVCILNVSKGQCDKSLDNSMWHYLGVVQLLGGED